MSQDSHIDGLSSPLKSSFRQSILSILRPGSRSPTQSRTHMHNVSQSPTVPVFSTMARDDSSYPTSKDEFADSETSDSPINPAEEADAETIYSVIKDYEETQNFLFSEDFNSTLGSDQKTKQQSLGESQSTKSSANTKDLNIHETNVFSDSSKIDSSPITFVTVSKSDKPSIVNTQRKTLLMLSTDLSVESQQINHNPFLSERISVGHNSAARVSVATPVKPRISPNPSQTGSVLNLLSDFKSACSREEAASIILSPLEQAYQSGFPTESFFHGSAEQNYSGVFSTLSFNNSVGQLPYSSKAYRPEPILTIPSFPQGTGGPEPYTDTCYRNPLLGSQEPSYSPKVPSILPTRDSTEKLRLHQTMLRAYEDRNLEAQLEPNLNYSWAKWLCMMLAALIIIPMFFLLALGMLDKKGFYYYDFLSMDEKPFHNEAFHLRYSTQQKLLSFIIGLIWLCTVLAMIGVGFGLGLTRLPQYYHI